MKSSDGHISKVAATMGVRASTLRFWESKGLVNFERNAENRYRVPSAQNLLQTVDVMLYRSLDMSIEEIKSCFGADLPSMQEMLREGKESVGKRIEELRRVAARIEDRRRAVARAEAVSKQSPSVIAAALPPFVPFDYETKEDVELMLKDPTLTGLMQEEEGARHRFIAFSGEAEEGREYVFGPLFAETDTQRLVNAQELRAYAKSLGRECGRLLGRYLATAAIAGVRTDIYEGYLELLR